MGHKIELTDEEWDFLYRNLEEFLVVEQTPEVDELVDVMMGKLWMARHGPVV